MRKIAALSVLMAAVLMGAAPGPSPPSPADAPREVAGPPAHGARVRPIPVLEGHTYAVPALLDGLADEDARVRARCCFLLGQISDHSARDALAGMLDDSERRVRQFAGMALARMGDERGFEACQSALVGNRWWVRVWAVESLARCGPDGTLEQAADDPDPLVRALAERALSNEWEPAQAETQYAGPANATLDDLILSLADYLIGEAGWWWHAGHYPQVLRAEETVLWLDPSWQEGFALAGYLYWSLGRDAEAIATYRKGVTVHPQSWQMRFELGFYYFNAQKRYADAMPQFEQARKLECPAVCARMHAHALEDAGYPRQALEVWQELKAEFGVDGVVEQNIARLRALLEHG